MGQQSAVTIGAGPAGLTAALERIGSFSCTASSEQRGKVAVKDGYVGKKTA